MFLVVGAVLVAALVLQQGATNEARRRLAVVGAAAFAIRLVAVAVVYLIAIRVHGEGTWLNDEASFYLSAEALFPNPLDTPLPQGLGHLSGNAYLGVLWAIAALLGHPDTVAWRLVNATLGAMVAVLVSVVTERFAGRRAALLAGLVVAAWPTLVLWSATMLRDTLASFVVIVLWWTLVTYGRAAHPRVIATVVSSIVLLATIRPYLAAAAGLGVTAWMLYPVLARRSRRTLAAVAAFSVIVMVSLGVARMDTIDQAAHQLVYRQTVTRLETLGMLYHDVPADSRGVNETFPPGAPVALVMPGSGWLLGGVVQESAGNGDALVGFTDGSLRAVPTANLTALESAPLSPLQMLANLGPGLATLISGASGTGEPGNGAWIADALAWDVLILLAIVGGGRARVPTRDWLLPACVLLGTAAALVAVPGAPGNEDRHRAPQVIPFLIVFAAGVVTARPRIAAYPARLVTTATSSPTTAPIPASSRTRSPR